ncbi:MULTISPECIES: late competence development ComFB family protein [unclassified Sporolactobacillus]|uniref:late competence development ComFB family protein n=1 Tax=unclassified Sporolactobacillus TaxID=2628533 RepID=UPI0023683923|nr:late competence development ComFB family protein [Sporolactobacillus sp. CQH2019]MDD9150753.1 late competence development ComFB family protein [Sporolactobacillus sp. CQH2019]
MIIHNVMEEAVEDILDKQWENLAVSCHCPECKMDVLALSLNRLKPRYVRNQAGGMYAKADLMTEQSRATILTAIVESSKVVSACPRHSGGMIQK